MTDPRGSVRLVVNVATGAVEQKRRHDAWGRVEEDSAPGWQPFGYAGGLYEPVTGTVRFGAREYDPTTGRWMQKDPIRFAGGDSNLFAYVQNDPVNFIDPNGENPWAIAAGIGVVLTFGAFVENSDDFSGVSSAGLLTGAGAAGIGNGISGFSQLSGILRNYWPRIATGASALYKDERGFIGCSSSNWSKPSFPQGIFGGKANFSIWGRESVRWGVKSDDALNRIRELNNPQDVAHLSPGDIRTAIEIYKQIAQNSPSVEGAKTASARVQLLEHILRFMEQ